MSKPQAKWIDVHSQNNLLLSSISVLAQGIMELNKTDVAKDELARCANELSALTNKHKELELENVPGPEQEVTGDEYPVYYSKFSAITALMGDMEKISKDLTTLGESIND